MAAIVKRFKWFAHEKIDRDFCLRNCVEILLESIQAFGCYLGLRQVSACLPHKTRVKYSSLLTGHSWLSSVPTGSTCSQCGERRGKGSHKARCSRGAVAPPPPRAGAAPVRRVQTGAVQGAVSWLREGAPSTHRQVTLLDQVARSIEPPVGGGPIHIFWVFLFKFSPNVKVFTKLSSSQRELDHLLTSLGRFKISLRWFIPNVFICAQFGF